MISLKHSDSHSKIKNTHDTSTLFEHAHIIIGATPWGEEPLVTRVTDTFCSCEYPRGVNQKAANVHGARFCEASSHPEGALLGCESHQLFTPIKYKVTEKVHAQTRSHEWTFFNIENCLFPSIED